MDAPYHGVMCARMEFGFELQTEGASAMDITTIGFDLAKTVFQVHGADGEGRAVLRRKLRRGKVLAFFAGLPSCLVGMEACASAHYWAREIQALGHEVRLIPPQYVRPFVETNKNDAADAEAICEAVTRPTMRFAAAKSAEQQSVLMLHRARELLVRQRTMVINALRGHCAELGLIVAQGAAKVEELVAIIEDPGDVRLPPLAREALGSLVEQLRSAQARIKQLEATLGKRIQTCEGNDDLMAKQGSTRDRPNPRHCQSFELVNLTGRRSFGFHQGQRSAYRSAKAGYMTASSTAVLSQFLPCNTGGVHT